MRSGVHWPHVRRTLLDDARLELARAKAPETQKEDYLLTQRQAAEKAWGYLVEQVDTFFGFPRASLGPSVHGLRQQRLMLLERQSGEPVHRTYKDLAEFLHGECFYLGHCDIERLERAIETAAGFPEWLKNAERVARRRR